ncbi:TadE/TadG family type IV pilus assembly protein [Litoreibacter arenae]|uniref:Flp pilus assembly protein TadG n=1 Tax=Litoreibacter arenae DSM 19593 TaxID=1123360 RepID=S9RS59_9RHOB|nr:TadE family protein [Litoreibacter arenae]EPX80905.1 Flp pilus assembly protein TadG [Litoreibacter arenae DSM 19593]
MTHRKRNRPVRFLRSLMGREDGNATIEFAILFPVFMLIFMSIFEIGMLMTRYMMFDRALDVAVRHVRLAEDRSFTQDQVKQLLCSQTVILRNHCLEDLMLEMVRLDEDDQNWVFPTDATPCRDLSQEVQPATAHVTGEGNDVIFVRACMSIEPFFPTAALGEYLTRDSAGRLNMIAMSAFSVEPNE